MCYLLLWDWTISTISPIPSRHIKTNYEGYFATAYVSTWCITQENFNFVFTLSSLVACSQFTFHLVIMLLLKKKKNHRQQTERHMSQALHILRSESGRRWERKIAANIFVYFPFSKETRVCLSTQYWNISLIGNAGAPNALQNKRGDRCVDF